MRAAQRELPVPNASESGPIFQTPVGTHRWCVLGQRARGLWRGSVIGRIEPPKNTPATAVFLSPSRAGTVQIQPLARHLAVSVSIGRDHLGAVRREKFGSRQRSGGRLADASARRPYLPEIRPRPRAPEALGAASALQAVVRGPPLPPSQALRLPPEARGRTFRLWRRTVPAPEAILHC